MFTTTKIALAAIMIFGAASAALATDHEDDTSSQAQINRDWADAQRAGQMGNSGSANAYAPQDFQSHRKSR